MSDNSMAFLAGGAFAGIAVLLLLKGGVNPSQANFQPAVQQSPLAVQPTATLPPSLLPASPPGNYTEQQRLLEERLKTQLEQQRAETEQLKAQLRNQQMVIDAMNSQTQANSLNPHVKAATQILPAAEQQSQNPMFTGILWAAGGAAVTLVGGAFVLGALALLSQQQRGRRTVQVIHPINTGYSPTLHTRRRSEFLPPRIVESRRVEEVEYDER